MHAYLSEVSSPHAHDNIAVLHIHLCIGISGGVALYALADSRHTQTDVVRTACSECVSSCQVVGRVCTGRLTADNTACTVRYTPSVDEYV